MEIDKIIQAHLAKHQTDFNIWLQKAWIETPPPLYGSLDIRDSGFKAVCVDMNLFPAGFNNLHPDNLPDAVNAIKTVLLSLPISSTWQKHPPLYENKDPRMSTFTETTKRSESNEKNKKILLIPENHTRNLFYFESLFTLHSILEQAGYETRIGFLGEDDLPKTIQLSAHKKVLLEKITRQDNHIFIDDFSPNLIILNNDLSSGIPDLLKNLKQPILPLPELGWAFRLKSEYFSHYESVINQASYLLDIDPWLLRAEFRACGEVNFLKREGEECLAHHAGVLLSAIQKKYKEYGIIDKPFVVIKADAGTYGMSVMMINDPSDIVGLNRKARTSMSASKGGNPVHQVMIQEGVHSRIKYQGLVAEPVMYLIGTQVVGGFYRMHANKNSMENLNSPGMMFNPFIYHHNPSFTLYTLIAELSMLAAAREQQR